MKNISLCFLFLLSSCGIQGPSSTIALYPPNGLMVTYSNSRREYTVTFQALNPEENFSGYNLYYTTSLASAELGQGQKVVLKSAIINDRDPTFIVNQPFDTVQTFTYVLNEDKMPNNFFYFTTTQASDYRFVVRSYDRAAARESVSSRYYRTYVPP